MTKTTKSQLTKAVESFFWNLSYRNGGTKSENEQQAPALMEDLTKQSIEIMGLLANAGKVILKDEWLCERAESTVSRAAKFSERYAYLADELDPTEDENIPENVILHNFRAA